ncbi:hypothetical protein [Chryseobacterium echinoideorum]|uniref:hypothetical protein n=1 Tax=Chryseobacterium echinoideorum TaxID=1549648 RepID=UPI001185DA9A|nr:hypothetical protein [Chryseobacterium echinoideorum]
MKYKFETQKLDIDKYPYYFIRLEERIYYPLGRFSDWGWTPQKVQTIIDGVKLGKIKPYGEEYNWASEDLEIYVNQKGVLLIDMLAQRAGKQDPKSSTLELKHEEFLQFLQDFKKFVESNI